MAKLTLFERLFPIRISIKDWSIGYYYNFSDVSGDIKIFRGWFALKCGICHKWSRGCGELNCSFCGICSSCNKRLEEMYNKENKFI